MSGGYFSRVSNAFRRIPFAVGLTLVLCSWSHAATTVLLNDAWADGSRAETNLPNESAVWVGIPSGGGTVSVVEGALSMTQGGSNQKLWTYFAPDGNPVELAVGQKLRATIEFLAHDMLYNVNNRNFRVGLFHDPTDAQILSNVNSDGGGTGNPWTDSTGYAVMSFLTSGPTTASAFQIGKRTDLTTSSLLGSTGAYTFPSPQAGGASITHQLDTLYTLEFELDYISTSEMSLTARISDNTGVLSQHTVSDNGTTLGTAAPYTKFDHLFFRFSSASGTADELEFRRLKIELESPDTGGLLGDFNEDGVVDAADYVLWRKTDGSLEEYEQWRANFGAVGGSGVGSTSTLAVPEPTTWIMLVLTAAMGRIRGRRGLRVSGSFLQK